jgi:hypothetical protein
VTNTAIALATLIFAALAGIGSLIRVYQNRRPYRFHKRVHEAKLARERRANRF